MHSSAMDAVFSLLEEQALSETTNTTARNPVIIRICFCIFIPLQIPIVLVYKTVK
jgi:hypothetical protein